MDEQEREARIAAAFREAAAEPPPPGFDAGDVVAASRRITRRRRSALAGGLLAVLVVAGVGVAAGSSGSQTVTAASAGVADDRGAQAGRAAPPQVAGPDAGAAPEAAAGSGAGLAAGAPLGPGTRECADRQDPALRALVEQALPEVVGAPEAMTTMECRPGGERGVALEVRDGPSSGLLSVTYLPPGSAVDPPDGARTAPTASGGTVIVASRPDREGEQPPLAGRLDAAVAYLAPRL